jgi:hypothetical protein
MESGRGGAFEGISRLFLSGYGVNLSYPEYNKRPNDPGMDGDKRFLEFTPKSFSKIASELKASIAPLTVGFLERKGVFLEKENELNIFKQFRAPVSNSVLANLRSTQEGQTVEKDMPSLKWDGATMPGDSGGGVFKVENKLAIVVGVNAGGLSEHEMLQTFYFGYAAGITKNPARNTYDWIKKLILEKELKIPVPAKK